MTKCKFWKDSFASTPLTNMEALIAVALGLLLLVVVFQVAPLLGNAIDEAADLGGGNTTDAVAADGKLVPTECDEFEFAEGDSVTIGTTIFEFAMEGGCIDTNAVCIEDIEPACSIVFPMLVDAINANATTSALVDATSEVDPDYNLTVVSLVADTPGTDGNSVITSTRLYHAWAEFNNGTLVGGADACTCGSEWVSDDIPTGAEVWVDTTGLLLIIVLVAILGLAIMYIKGML